MSRFATELTDLAEEIADTARRRGSTVAIAENVTAGRIAACLSTADADPGWFAGAIVATSRGLRARLLGVAGEEAVSAAVAEQMVAGILALSGADVALAVTGALGPDAVEGHAPGTTFIAVGSADRIHVFEHHLDGEPGEVVGLAVLRGLQHLKGALLELS